LIAGATAAGRIGLPRAITVIRPANPPVTSFDDGSAIVHGGLVTAGRRQSAPIAGRS